jgi:hypothetical protein
MKTDQSEERSHLLADAAWEMEQVLGQWRLPLEVDAATLLQMIAAMELALRNPQFRARPAGKDVRRFVDRLVASIPESAPATRRVAQTTHNFFA